MMQLCMKSTRRILIKVPVGVCNPTFSLTYWLSGVDSDGCCPIIQDLEMDSSWPVVSGMFWPEYAHGTVACVVGWLGPTHIRT